MLGSDGWQQRKADDDAVVALRYKRLAQLRARAALGGADGVAAALVARELEDLDGERLTRVLATAKVNDALVVRGATEASVLMSKYRLHLSNCFAFKTHRVHCSVLCIPFCMF